LARFERIWRKIVVIIARIKTGNLKYPSEAARKVPIKMLANARGSVRKRMACSQARKFDIEFNLSLFLIDRFTASEKYEQTTQV
jgi:hypothetical protein